MNRIIITLLLIASISFQLSGQKSDLPQSIKELKSLRINALETENFKERLDYNRRFKENLKILIESESKDLALLDSVPNLGLIESPDKNLTIYCWNLIHENGSFEYYSIFDIKGSELIIPNDASEKMRDPLHSVNRSNDWYGALYYEIIPTKIKKKGTYYVLLGWDGKNQFGTRKIIDVFHYDEQLKNWLFGKKVFGPPYAEQTRFFLQYSAEAVVSLKYHEKEAKIVFDHLIPPNRNLEGVYDMYLPDMSFDAFEFRKDRWYFVQHVDVRGDQTMDGYVDPNPGGRRR